MNERIQQLVKRASTTTTSYYDGRGNVTETYFDKEKFAELIVEECVKLCEYESNNDIYDPYDMGMSGQSNNIKTAIKEHFGVES
jgi:hypothetical protein